MLYLNVKKMLFFEIKKKACFLKAFFKRKKIAIPIKAIFKRKKTKLVF